jgi:hypothetical protein
VTDQLPAAPIKTVDAVVDTGPDPTILYGRRRKQWGSTPKFKEDLLKAEFSKVEERVFAMHDDQVDAMRYMLVMHDPKAFHVRLTEADIQFILGTLA